MKCLIYLILFLGLFTTPSMSSGEQPFIDNPQSSKDERITACLKQATRTLEKLSECEIQKAKTEKDKFLLFFEADNFAYFGLGLFMGVIIE